MSTPHTPWPPSELALLHEIYPHLHTADVAALMQCSASRINNAAYKAGLRKSAEYLASDTAMRIQRGKQHPNMIAHRYGDNPSSVPAGYPYTDTLPAQTTVEAFQDGGAEAFEEDWYWSSTQYSDSHAWGQYFGYGTQGFSLKSYEGRCRAVRLIQLIT